MAPCASACAAALFLACAGCTLISPDVEVAVEIPPLPDAWAQSLSGVGFTLIYLDGDGAQAETTIAAGERSAAIRVLKASCSPILAFPWASSAPVGVLRPAGGFAAPEGG